MATQYMMQRDTASWRMQVWISFGLAILASAVGVPEEISRSQVTPSREVARVYTHTEVERVQRAYAKMPWLAGAND